MLVETKRAAYRIGIHDNYTSKNFLLRWLFWKRLQIILKMAEKISDSESVLDFGSGWGVLLQSLSEIFQRVQGVDIHRPSIERAQQLIRFLGLNYKNIQIFEVKPDDKLLMFKDKTFDCIVATDVLEHIPNLRDTLLSFKRILKNDGWLIASIPTENILYRFAQKFLGHPASRSWHVHNPKTVIETVKEIYVIKEQHNLLFFKILRGEVR